MRTHGKWTAFDVSEQIPFNLLLGAQAEFVVPILNPRDSVVGFEATFPRALLRVEVEADELLVDLVSMSDPDMP